MADVEQLPHGLLIGDSLVSDTSAGSMPHINPATGEVQQHFPIAGPAEVERAVQAAKASLETWRSWSPTERRAVLQELGRLLRERADEFGHIATRECGLPRAMSSYLAPGAAEWIEYYAGWTDKLTGDTIPVPGMFDYTVAEPVGVVAVILTWNSSAAAYGASVGAALAAGCAVVIKPAELAPFSGTLFGQLCLEAGIPPGVVSVLPGGPEAGDALVRHRDVAKISFTGGLETARRIQAAAAESFTPLLLELGGKSANIVFADADIERVVSVAVSGLAALNGQTCIAPTRLLVERSRYDEVVDAVVAGVEALSLGDPFDPATAMGPVISDTAVKRILGVVDRAKAERSGELVTGGDRLTDGPGYFVAPTVFRNVDNTSALAQTEVFGPVLAVLPFEDDDEAVRLANATEFGLAAYVQTRDLARAHAVASRLDAGTVWVNAPGNPVPAAPFGGVKSSGYGKQGGWAGIAEFTRFKNIGIALT